MGYRLQGRTPRLPTSQPTIDGPCLIAFDSYTDRLNTGGTERWKKEQAGSTSRQFRVTLHDTEGFEGFEGAATSYFLTLPSNQQSPRVADSMLDAMRLVYESFGYDPAALDAEDAEVECGDDLVEDSKNGNYARGYYFAGDDGGTDAEGKATPGHWGKLLLLTPELHAQAVEGAYTPPRPKLRVRKDRDAGETPEVDDEETPRAPEARRPQPAPQRAAPQPAAPRSAAPVPARPAAPAVTPNGPTDVHVAAPPQRPTKPDGGSLRNALK